jgi:hypothetical protein
MKTFIFSYLVSVLTIVFASFSAVQAAPLDVIPRICFYFGLPSAVVLSIVIIVLNHLLGLSTLGRSINSKIINSSTGMTLQPEAKAA